MRISPARIDTLSVDGDELDSTYTLGVANTFIGDFDNFYALEKLINDPIGMLRFLESEGVDTTTILVEGIDFGGGVFYGPERFQEDSTED